MNPAITHVIDLSAYQPVHLVLIGVAVLVLTVVTGQVLLLGHRNRAAARARRAQRCAQTHRDTPAVLPEEPSPTPTGVLTVLPGGRA